MRGGETRLAKPPMNCRIARLFGRSATPIKSTATMANTVVVQPANKIKYLLYSRRN